MKFDSQKFFNGYREAFSPLNQNQVDGLNALLQFISEDHQLESINQCAYMLETTRHETGETFQPIKEIGSRSYFIKRYGGQTRLGKRLGNDTPEEGAIYAGRGFVQLTGEDNYERMELEIRREYPQVVKEFEEKTGKLFDLTVGDQLNDGQNADNAMDPKIAYLIMSLGMRKGLFTGKRLSDYIDPGDLVTPDYYGARRIVNPGEINTKPELVRIMASNAQKWESILLKSKESETEPAPPPLPVEAPKETFIQASVNSTKRLGTWLTGMGVSVTGAATGVFQFAGNNPVLLLICISVAIIAVVVGACYYQYLLHKSDTQRREIAADPNKINVV